MSIGERRRYVIREIVPRHFLQEAEAVGLPRETTSTLFAELLDRAASAIEVAKVTLPSDTPESLIESITTGLGQRLRILEGQVPVKRTARQ